jgi:hypothetical protein
MSLHHKTGEYEPLIKALNLKADNAIDLARKLVKTTSLLPIILEGLSAKEGRVKFKSAKVLKLISENNPELLYLYFEVFQKLLHSDNNILKWNAIDIMANLTPVDSDNKFDALFDEYFDLFCQGSLITAAHIAENSAVIADTKPALCDKITNVLLSVENIPLPTEECRNILKGKVIESLAKYFDRVTDKGKINKFVENQLGNSRNATKKKAEKFLRTYKFS